MPPNFESAMETKTKKIFRALNVRQPKATPRIRLGDENNATKAEAGVEVTWATLTMGHQMGTSLKTT